MPQRFQKAAVFLVSGGVTAVFFINFCAWIYSCGCRSLWAGAALHCNIHIPGARHCPWCSSGVLGYRAALLAIIAPQAVVSFWNARWSILVRLAVALVTFPVMGAVVAGFLGLLTGYWSSS